MTKPQRSSFYALCPMACKGKRTESLRRGRVHFGFSGGCGYQFQPDSPKEALLPCPQCGGPMTWTIWRKDVNLTKEENHA